MAKQKGGRGVWKSAQNSGRKQMCSLRGSGWCKGPRVGQRSTSYSVLSELHSVPDILPDCLYICLTVGTSLGSTECGHFSLRLQVLPDSALKQVTDLRKACSPPCQPRAGRTLPRAGPPCSSHSRCCPPAPASGPHLQAQPPKHRDVWPGGVAEHDFIKCHIPFKLIQKIGMFILLLSSQSG